jgi:hypothetical protein
MGMNEKAQSKRYNRDGVQVVGPSSTNHRRIRPPADNWAEDQAVAHHKRATTRTQMQVVLDEEAPLEGANGAIQSGIPVLWTSPTAHHCNHAVAE